MSTCNPCGNGATITIPVASSACRPGPRGERGPSGSAGTNGDDGLHAYTLTTNSFVVPDVGASVTVDVGNGAWIGSGQIIYVAGAGYFSASAPAAEAVTLTNLGYGPNAAPLTNIAAGAVVSPGGPKGNNAPDDTRGYVLLRRELADGTDNGTLTSGSWTARLLNTTAKDTKGLIVSLDAGTGIFRVKPGVYKVRAEAPAFDVNRHRARIRNITSGGTALYGTSEFTGDNGQTNSLVLGVLVLGVETDLVLESRCQVTKTTTGRGVAANFGEAEVFEFVELTELQS